MDGREESASLRRRVGIDREALAVDHDVVVEPAQGGEVPGIGDTAVGPLHDVMNLEAVERCASVDGAAVVTVGSASRRLAVDTSLFAMSVDRSSRPATHSTMVRHPSAVCV
jgi:hypothetical protein